MLASELACYKIQPHIPHPCILLDGYDRTADALQCTPSQGHCRLTYRADDGMARKRLSAWPSEPTVRLQGLLCFRMRKAKGSGKVQRDKMSADMVMT